MQKGLVSIITPCYNSELFVYRLLDSILKQTYKPIEMFIVDDDSTDNTLQVLNDYKQKFQGEGISYCVLHQVNQGQSVAINYALKYVNGEYLVWPDSDDFYSSENAISELVKALESTSDEITLSRCLQVFLDENTLKETHRTPIPTNGFSEDLFEDCLFIKNGWWFTPGGFMLKMPLWEKLNGGRDIFTERFAGQNWQMLLPALYKHKCKTVYKYLQYILIRTNSHSRGSFVGYESQMNRLLTYEQTVLETLNKISFDNEEEKIDYIKQIKQKYIKEKLFLTLRHKRFLKSIKYFLSIDNRIRTILKCFSRIKKRLTQRV